MQRLSARIVAELEGDILAGNLPPGERLASEEKLCSRFGASRTVIREAIQQLRGRGLLRTLKGSGTYIANPSLKSLGSAIETYSVLAEEADFFELIDFRILVEGECARLAALRAGKQDIRNIREGLRRLDEAQGSREDFAAADIRFHLAIATASGNRLYTTLLGALEKRCIAFAQENRIDDDWFGDVFQQHAGIFEAIEAARSEDAAAAMRRHLIASRRHFVDLKKSPDAVPGDSLHPPGPGK